jgi:UDP-N-acetyl-D-glucosamine dehydrogenase
MPHWVIGKCVDALNERGRALKGSRVLVLGIAYKKNVDDMRESPAVELMELLAERGAHVEYSDPHVPVFPQLRRGHFDLKTVALTPASVASYDMVLVATNHDAFDYGLVLKSARLIVDTRGVYLDPAPNVVKA